MSECKKPGCMVNHHPEEPPSLGSKPFPEKREELESLVQKSIEEAQEERIDTRELLKQTKALAEVVHEISKTLEAMDNLNRYAITQLQDYTSFNNKSIVRVDDKVRRVSEFLALPWWKRMFRRLP